MTLKNRASLLLFLFAVNFYGQEKNKDDFNSIITLGAFSPIAYRAPRWNLGFIRKIDKRYWIGLDLGYGNDNISINYAEEGGWINNDYNLYEIRPEIYYNLRPSSKLRHLLSVELFYINHTDKFKNSWFYDLNDNTYYTYDYADYERIKMGVNLNYNLVFNITKNFGLMQKVGFGFRYRNVRYSNIINKTEDPYFEEPEGFIFPKGDEYLHDNGILTGFNFNLDLKIIYKF